MSAGIKKIPNLPTAVPFNGSEYIVLSQDGKARKALPALFQGPQGDPGATGATGPAGTLSGATTLSGAAGNGTTDDYTAIADAFSSLPATSYLLFPPGTYRINTSLTITKPFRLSPGAVLKPASGVTIRIQSPLEDTLHQIFDTALGGVIRFGAIWSVYRWAGWTHAEVIRPEWWGVPFDTEYDAYAALQAAFDAAAEMPDASNTEQRAPDVKLMPRLYRFNKPLRFKGSHTGLIGVGQSSILSPLYPFGATMVVAGTDYGLFPTTTALLSGTGTAHTLNNQYWVNLSDCDRLKLNGLSAFCVELTVKFPGTIPSDFAIISSSGARFDAAMTAAFNIYGAGGYLWAEMRIGGTYHTLEWAYEPAINTQYALALTYDGSTVRMFVNGSVVASEAASGTVTQDFCEDVTIGPQIGVWPDVNRYRNPINGTIVDGVRISNTARYTSTYTPSTSKPAVDSNTLVAANFAENFDCFTRLDTWEGPCWTWLRHEDWESHLTNFVRVKNVRFKEEHRNGGIVLIGSIKSHLERVHVDHSLYGIYYWNNNYIAQMDQCSAFGSYDAKFGIAAIWANNVNRYRDLNIAGGAFLFIGERGPFLMDNAWLEAYANTRAMMLLGGDGVGYQQTTILECKLSAETGPPNLIAPLILSGQNTYNMVGGLIELGGTAGVPLAIIHGGEEHLFSGVSFTGLGVTPSTIFASPVIPPSQPVHLIAPRRFGNAPSAPWSDGNCPVLIDNSKRLQGGVPNAAPTDADLSKSQVSWYVDESSNTIKARVRYSGGTYKTFSGSLI